MLAATIVFALSFALIVGLFGLKYFEMRRGERVAKAMRVKADRAALELKDTLVHGRQQIEKLPPEIAHVSMRAMVAGALSAASLGRSIEHQAHRFADFVASKRGFQRRETKSEFLKEVSDFKNDRTEE